MATSINVRTRIGFLYEVEGFSQVIIHEKINQEYPDEGVSLKTVQNLIERHNMKKNSKNRNRRNNRNIWDSRKWLNGTGFYGNDIRYRSRQKKEIFEVILKTAKRRKSRWVEWWLSDLYKRDINCWDKYEKILENPELQKELDNKNKSLLFKFDSVFGFGSDRSEIFMQGVDLANLIYRDGNTFISGMTVLNEWLGAKDEFNLIKFLDIFREYKAHLYQVNMGNNPGSWWNTPQKEFRKIILSYTLYFKRMIDQYQFNITSKGDLSSPDTLDTIEGLDALYERLPVFSSIPRSSKYKDLELFQIFLKIFRSEPINNQF